jgi:hypothetical protein
METLATHETATRPTNPTILLACPPGEGSPSSRAPRKRSPPKQNEVMRSGRVMEIARVTEVHEMRTESC